MSWIIVLLAGCPPDSEFQALKPDIVVTPDSLDLGEVVEDYSGASTVQIINGGMGELDLSAVTVTGDPEGIFTVGEFPESLDHDESWPLEVRFTPADPLAYSATLTIASNDEEKPTVEVALTGTGIVAPTPDISCDPMSLDFDTVAAGGVGTKWTTCTNLGDDDLFISAMTQVGSGAFALQTDPTGYTLLPGQTLPLIVVYSPSSEAGDNGYFTLSTNDPDEPVTQITMVGNGGGDFDYPVAVIDGPASAEPRETITLAGGGSYDPNGYEPLTYTWTVTGPYSDVPVTESGTDLYVQLDLAGAYRVSLQVTNTIGLVSAPAVYTVSAVPSEQLHVELVWDSLPDLDLHLSNSSGGLFENPYDCNYCNVAPAWGAIGTADDPSLDIDARASPPGIENINIDGPAADTYTVRVHYFEDNGAGDVTATVNVYLYGVLEASYSKVMSRNKVWDVAQITWPDGVVVEESTGLYAPTLRTCE